MTILGLDVSHYQQGVNFAQVKASGRDFVYLKATEGIGYVDSSFSAFRQQAHAAGLVVGIYHFARDNAPAAEAAYFAGVVGALQPGEFLVLDQEVGHAMGNVAWCQQWLDATRAHYGIAPLIYMNQGSATGVASGNWTTLAQTYGLILARYDNAPTVLNTTPYWGSPAMKQYSDAGSVPGVPGTCDVDVFYGTADQLRAYGYQGSTTDMPLTQAEKDEIVTRTVEGVINRVVVGKDLQLWQVLAAVYGKTVGETHDLAGRPVDAPDDLFGHVLSTEARVRDVATKVAQATTPTLDEAKLAAALLADPASVDALGKAIAAHLKLASG